MSLLKINAASSNTTIWITTEYLFSSLSLSFYQNNICQILRGTWVWKVTNCVSTSNIRFESRNYMFQMNSFISILRFPSNFESNTRHRDITVAKIVTEFCKDFYFKRSVTSMALKIIKICNIFNIQLQVFYILLWDLFYVVVHWLTIRPSSCDG